MKRFRAWLNPEHHVKRMGIEFGPAREFGETWPAGWLTFFWATIWLVLLFGIVLGILTKSGSDRSFWIVPLLVYLGIVLIFRISGANVDASDNDE